MFHVFAKGFNHIGALVIVAAIAVAFQNCAPKLDSTPTSPSSRSRTPNNNTGDTFDWSTDDSSSSGGGSQTNTGGGSQTTGGTDSGSGSGSGGGSTDTSDDPVDPVSVTKQCFLQGVAFNDGPVTTGPMCRGGPACGPIAGKQITCVNGQWLMSNGTQACTLLPGNDEFSVGYRAWLGCGF